MNTRTASLPAFARLGHTLGTGLLESAFRLGTASEEILSMLSSAGGRPPPTMNLDLVLQALANTAVPSKRPAKKLTLEAFTAVLKEQRRQWERGLREYSKSDGITLLAAVKFVEVKHLRAAKQALGAELAFGLSQVARIGTAMAAAGR